MKSLLQSRIFFPGRKSYNEGNRTTGEMTGWGKRTIGEILQRGKSYNEENLTLWQLYAQDSED